jgi:hypothetical protein
MDNEEKLQRVRRIRKLNSAELIHSYEMCMIVQGEGLQGETAQLLVKEMIKRMDRNIGS